MMQARKNRKIKAVEPSGKADSYYSAQMQSLVRLMAKQLSGELVPLLQRLKPEYVADARPTMDSWSDEIVALIRRVASQFTSTIFQAQADRIARRTVSMADADNAQDFLRSVNAAIGIPFPRSPSIDDYLAASVNDNVGLIKSIPQQYFSRIENIVLGNMRQGFVPTKIAKDIQAETGVTYRRAKLIARDQVAKLNSDLTQRRQKDAGIDFYRSSNSNDQRVSGKPGGKYPNAKISCWGISQQDIGYGKGVYKVSEGASWAGQTGLHPGQHHPLCRCVAISMIPGVNYFPDEKKPG